MTREEAINKVRWRLMGLVMDEDTSDAFGTLIPELRESEDERIRRELIEYLKGDLDDITTDDTDRWIAYLEKQKESLHISESCKENAEYFTAQCGDNRFELIDKAKRDIIAETNIESSPDEMKVLDSFLFRAWQMGWLGKYDVIVPEQKPAEWSEDWREEDIQTRFAFYTYKDEDGVLYLSNVFVEEASRNHGFGTKILIAAEKVAETIGATTISLKVKQDSPANAWYRKNGYGYVTFEDGYDWLEKNLEYMKPNKQEWGEEDDWKRKELIQYLEEKGDYRTVWITWLKSLRPQPHWKPGEEQSEVDLDATVNEAFDKYSSVDGYGQLVVSFNRAELYSFIKKIARKEENK